LTRSRASEGIVGGSSQVKQYKSSATSIASAAARRTPNSRKAIRSSCVKRVVVAWASLRYLRALA